MNGVLLRFFPCYALTVFLDKASVNVDINAGVFWDVRYSPELVMRANLNIIVIQIKRFIQ